MFIELQVTLGVQGQEGCSGFDRESAPLVSGTTVDMSLKSRHEEKITGLIDRADNFFRSERLKDKLIHGVRKVLLSQGQKIGKRNANSIDDPREWFELK
jgi:hypothetical protein